MKGRLIVTKVTEERAVTEETIILLCLTVPQLLFITRIPLCLSSTQTLGEAGYRSTFACGTLLARLYVYTSHSEC